jgi:hypothetical protein
VGSWHLSAKDSFELHNLFQRPTETIEKGGNGIGSGAGSRESGVAVGRFWALTLWY